RPKHELSEKLCLESIKLGIDLLVGTSMGGYMVAAIGDKLGVPFVAINPAIEPRESLKKTPGFAPNVLWRTLYIIRRNNLHV
ncbi:MAG: YqiA/YcfP family alpha/beta fold hydrolase, partial [Candidatus Thioglobus sp.]